MEEQNVFRTNVGTLSVAVVRGRSNPNPWNVLVIDVRGSEREEALREAGFTAPQAHLGTNLVAVETQETLTLVDTGWGSGERLHDLLRSGGVNPERVNLLVLTHTDMDHVGGLLTETGLAFPQAEHVMHAAAWEWWTSETYLDLLGADESGFVERAASALSDRVTLVEGGAEVAPGVTIRELPGHSVGHIGVVFRQGGELMLHWADGLLHPIFIDRPGWHSGIDSDAELAAATRSHFLSWASEREAWIATTHFPFPGLGRIVAADGDWRWESVASR